jgi:uncharacterized membrane protein
MPFLGMLVMPVGDAGDLPGRGVRTVVPLIRWLGLGPWLWHDGVYQGSSTGLSGTALDILDQRFAHGEIDQAEYQKR